MFLPSPSPSWLIYPFSLCAWGRIHITHQIQPSAPLIAFMVRWRFLSLCNCNVKFCVLLTDRNCLLSCAVVRLWTSSGYMLLLCLDSERSRTLSRSWLATIFSSPFLPCIFTYRAHIHYFYEIFRIIKKDIFPSMKSSRIDRAEKMRTQRERARKKGEFSATL